jgi:DNA gyrase subunit B
VLEVVKDPEKHIWLPKVTVQHHGVFHESLINKDLFISSEYRKMISLGDKLKDLLQPGAYVQRGEKKLAVTSFAQVFEWIMAEAKKGQTIQRYKGLGEMNPEQLWETTMDPEVRRLLQVTVEDAVAADHIFTTLMGDQVEPRREFIEANAQEVENLDI